MAAEEEYQRTGFEGKDLKAIDTLLRTYFDASGWEFSELIQANRNYYIKQGASPHPDQYEFFKDKDIIIDYPIDLYTKLEDFTRNDEYLITDDRQDTIIWLLPDFYSYNFASSKLFEATNDSGFYYFSEFVRPDMLRLFRSMHELFTAQKPFDQLGVSSKPLKIVYGNKEIALKNEDNWFFQHLKEYLDTYLKEKTIEEVHTELSLYKDRVGAKSDHTINRIITQLYHFLQEETPYHDPLGKKTDKICTFIARFLSLMGYITILPDEEEFNIRQKERKKSKILRDWIATIRTKISDNLKWEETNGKFKSVTNEILSHKSYKEYNSEGVTLDTPLSELFPKYW